MSKTWFFKIEPDDASLKTWNLVNDSIKGFNSEVNTLVCHHAEYDQLVQEKTRVNVDSDISCLHVTPIAEKANYSKFAVVGLWHDNSVNIYSLPGLDLVGKEILGGVESLPHSVLMCSFNRRSYLFCGLADGHLMQFELNMVTGQLKGGELLGKKKLSLETQPVTLCAFLSNESTRIFAASNTSLVIYNNNEKIFCCEVNNLNDVRLMSPYRVEAFPNSCSFSEDDNVYYCVGTAYLKLDANECTKGSELHQVAEMETDGAVYCLNAFTGKLLAAINQNIKLYKWASLKNGRGRELKPGCLYRGFNDELAATFSVGDGFKSEI
ncbi:hypothetical protein H5410_024639 [Solanum commersonii]|uniref:RSE1/DDB1/CPSF1 second beta-propeller domain-containing protein n=1 Tax=Solanum commersonii TaxID=4109 RepID=A0A9J5ZMJ7_SOLCO|nr:hypothetical protein H5410_024639 [Solanum commersonii]